MASVVNHIDNNPIPAGYKIWKNRLEVAGVSFRKRPAAWLASQPIAWVELERDSSNSHDRNAIKVIGCVKGLFGVKRKFVGYVPAEVAAQMVEQRMLDVTMARLTRTYTGDNGYIEIRFQILVKKDAG